MLTEKRQEEILKLLDTRGSLTVQELTEYFQASESTIRRDLTVLDKKGALVKVFGGAVQKEKKLITREEKVSLRMELYREEKLRIGRYAASLIAPDDFVYLDAGTTTGCIIPYLTEHSASFVTNAVSHALQLAEHGFRVILIGGELKSSTEAIVGNEAFVTLQKYHFTKGFFGTNGVSRAAGFTTPDANEALVKKTAVEQCMKAYMLCDNSKFNVVSAVTFTSLASGIILTDKKQEEFEEIAEIIYT